MSAPRQPARELRERTTRPVQEAKEQDPELLSRTNHYTVWGCHSRPGCQLQGGRGDLGRRVVDVDATIVIVHSEREQADFTLREGLSQACSSCQA